ncbi:MAG: LptF/LptG family permease [Clostridia bacterium]|nr:LPS export ABC transporter permease LptG [Bacillota bacterium]MBO2521848.1 LPS export ABC transporter permease LptG [Bacillota bacterium]
MRLRPTLLDRYIIREMMGPLAFGVGAFTSLFVSGDLLSLANLVVELGAPIEPALKVFLLKLPQIIVWTLPMSVLLATLLSLSRLSQNSEIVAMRAGGMSFGRLAAPILCVSLLISVVSFLINETVVPHTNAESRRVMVEEVRGSRLPTITRHVVIKGERGNNLDWILYANRYDSRTSTFYQATLVYMNDNAPVQTAFADRIVWNERTWVMENGIAYHFTPEGEVVVATYPAHSRPVDLGQRPEDVARLQKSPEEMGLAELREHIETLRRQGADVRSLQVQMHLKYSIPVASLVFALVGIPLGIQSHRAGSATGFGMSVIIIFIYYIMMTLGSALGQAGALPPVLAAWIQNIIMGGYGAYCFYVRSK